MRFSILSVLAVLSTAGFAYPTVEASPLTPLNARTNGWAIKNFTRTSNSQTAPVTYTFVLDTYGTLTSCTIVDTTNPAWYHAIADVPCKDAPLYHVNWGWDYAGDFTVLVVESWPASGPRQKAYFGYDHPNVGLPGTVHYPDKGYNPPQ